MGGKPLCSFKGHFRSWLQVGFPTPQLGAKMTNLEPRCPADPPTWSQDASKMPPRCLKTANLRPTWRPRASNLTLRCSKKP